MNLETVMKALGGPRRIILTGRMRPSGKADYLRRREPAVRGEVRRLWRDWRDALAGAGVAALVQAGTVQPRLRDAWLDAAQAWYNDRLKPELEGALRFAGERIIGTYNRRTKAAAFNATLARILDWTREHGGELIRQLTEGQAATINVLLQHQVFMGITSPAELSRRLKPMIGLLRREGMAVLRYEAELLAQGLPPTKVSAMSARYSDFLLGARAERIARTELCFAFEFGQMESIRQIQEAGLVSDVQKEWMTAGDDRMCPDCAALDGETVGLDEEFSGGVKVPPLHSGCRCDVGYSATRQ